MGNRSHCPSCGNVVCMPSGHSGDLLIIGEFPSDEEMLQGRPFASNRNFISAGKILRKELELVGMSLSDHRVTNIWLHKPNNEDNCFQAGNNHVLSAPLIMAMINPASAMVMGHGIGEVRFAIKKWKSLLEREGLI